MQRRKTCIFCGSDVPPGLRIPNKSRDYDSACNPQRRAAVIPYRKSKESAQRAVLEFIKYRWKVIRCKKCDCLTKIRYIFCRYVLYYTCIILQKLFYSKFIEFMLFAIKAFFQYDFFLSLPSRKCKKGYTPTPYPAKPAKNKEKVPNLTIWGLSFV